MVTGSARLDYYRFGGDSLQGRYHFLRLHPLSVAELGIASAADFHSLLTLSGYPEPYLGGSEREARRWLAECTSSDRDVSPALRYLKERFPDAQAWQVSASGTRDYVSREGIRVAPAVKLLETLV